MDTGTIKSPDDDYTAGLLLGWKKYSDEEATKPDGMQVIIGGAGTNNQFDDNGTIMKMDSDLSGWSSSSAETTSVENMLKK